MPEDFETFLQHHGIKGQKWGVRRTPEQLGHKPSGKKRKASSTTKIAAAKKRKIKRKLSGLRKKKKVTKTVKGYRKAESYTDEELAKAVRRLQLENQYNQLIRDISKKQKSTGQKVVESMFNDVVVGAAKKTAKETLSKEMSKAVEEMLKKQRQERNNS